jgi:hypothetical protein
LLAERLAMPDAPPLHVYPRLWTESRNRYPHDWQWPDQLRCLCELVRDYRQNDRAAYCRLPDGERLFLQALDQCDPAEIIAMLRSDFPDEPNPMLRIDPSDPYVEQPRLNGHKVFDA